MAVVQDGILDAFIMELRERALSEFRHSEKENQDRYERVRELSMKLRDILSQFNEENRQTIKSYIEEKDSLTGDELDYVYLQGNNRLLQDAKNVENYIAPKAYRIFVGDLT